MKSIIPLIVFLFSLHSFALSEFEHSEVVLSVEDFLTKMAQANPTLTRNGRFPIELAREVLNEITNHPENLPLVPALEPEIYGHSLQLKERGIGAIFEGMSTNIILSPFGTPEQKSDLTVAIIINDQRIILPDMIRVHYERGLREVSMNLMYGFASPQFTLHDLVGQDFSGRTDERNQEDENATGSFSAPAQSPVGYALGSIFAGQRLINGLRDELIEDFTELGEEISESYHNSDINLTSQLPNVMDKDEVNDFVQKRLPELTRQLGPVFSEAFSNYDLAPRVESILGQIAREGQHNVLLILDLGIGAVIGAIDPSPSAKFSLKRVAVPVQIRFRSTLGSELIEIDPGNLRFKVAELTSQIPEFGEQMELTFDEDSHCYSYSSLFGTSYKFCSENLLNWNVERNQFGPGNFETREHLRGRLLFPEL